jgi:ADP-dependent NAD(P)H-hydrate dehydratase / NAD(P)H-hydrate epimerase
VHPDAILRIAEVRAVEARAGGAPLMERAGLAAADVARGMLGARSTSVLVLAGPGNNGGDAFVVARCLKSWFFDVTVAFCGHETGLAADAATAYRAWLDARGPTVREWPDRRFGLIVDGLFGIGLARPIEGTAAEWIARANASSLPILALDIPSGLDADTGVARSPATRASATATFIALKPGLLTGDGPDHCGTITVHGLDLDQAAGGDACGSMLAWETQRATIPDVLRRAQRNVNKGSFGTLGIVGGDDGMVGAAVLAGRAASHLGAGKVWVGLCATSPPAVDWAQPELMLRGASEVLDASPDALVIGPGLGVGDAARRWLAQALRLSTPLLIDADALNLIARDPDLASAVAARAAPTVLTPHPGEAARLCATTVDAIQGDRLRAALALAARMNAAVVLKGAGSIVAFPDGHFAINTSGSAALASAGTGDVLSGMIGALLAQGLPVDSAAPLAVCLHGAAADALVVEGIGPLGLSASELAPIARRLLNAR